MFRSFLLVYLRNARKDKVYVLLSVTILAISLCLVQHIGLIVMHEVYYDQDVPDYNRIYRIGALFKSAEGEDPVTSVPGGWVRELDENFESVTHATTVKTVDLPHNVKFEELNRSVLTEDLIWADTSFFDLFQISLEFGSVRSLQGNNSVVIAKSVAEEFFGDIANAIGKEITVHHLWATEDKEVSLFITGVFTDRGLNTHIKAKYIANLYALRDVVSGNFNDFLFSRSFSLSSFDSYIKVSSSAAIQSIEKELIRLGGFRDSDNDTWLEGIDIIPIIRRLDDLHFDSQFEWEYNGQGDKRAVLILVFVGFVILAVTSINYINISTARSLRRAKEIGLRKTLGGSPLYIAMQHFFESVLTVLLAFVLSTCVVVLLLDHLNTITGTNLNVSDVLTFNFFFTSIGFLAVLVVLSALYPAVVLSKLNVVSSLKEKSAAGKFSKVVRKGLVTFQLAATIFFLFCSLAVYFQVKQSIQTKLNAAGNQVIMIPFGGVGDIRKLQLFKDELASRLHSNVTSLNLLPRFSSSFIISKEFAFPGFDRKVRAEQLNADGNFSAVFSIQLLAGRGFHYADSNKLIINKTLAETIHPTAPFDLVGQSIVDRRGVQGTVMGIVEDFPIFSEKKRVGPLVVVNSPHVVDVAVYAKVEPEHYVQAIKRMEGVWNSVFPGVGFRYKFLNDEFRLLYATEILLSNVLIVITVFCFLLTFVGLYALISFWIEQRTKEIAVRKLHGAKPMDVLTIFYKEYSALFSYAVLISLPVYFISLDSLVGEFINEIKLSVGFCVLVLATLYGVGFVLCTGQTMKVVLMSVLKGIRSE